MRKAANVVFAFALVCLHAQTRNSLLLPESRRVTGVVIDSAGMPVANAHLDHTGDLRRAHTTDSEGRFELDTRAPAIVIRKGGFRSELLPNRDATEVRITLQEQKVSRFSTCSSRGQYQGIEGWGASFEFPKVQNVKASQQGRDIDYGMRFYYLKTKQGAKGIGHGSGPMWSIGIPLDEDIWRSVAYEEVTYDDEGKKIIDARGKLANGSRWRYLGKFGESASYSDADESAAKILDQVLDGACLKPSH